MDDQDRIQPVPESEVQSSHSMCEIRFDCLVTMYEMGTREAAKGFFVKEERRLNPQWFRSQRRITLDAIRNADEYMLGRQLKEMFHQLELHIKKYET